jgi:chemotaxis signal transduction protein
MTTDWSAAERALLAARTRALARPLDKDATPGDPAIVLAAGPERCAILVTFVHGVVRLTHLTRLPGVGRHVAGLFAHEGEVFPAFHLHAILDVGLGALPEYARAVLVGRDVPEAALVVERIDGIVEIPRQGLHEPPSDLSPRVRALLRGIAPDGIPVVDGTALLHSDALYVAPERAEHRGHR